MHSSSSMPSDRFMSRRGGRVNGYSGVAADDELGPVRAMAGAEPKESWDWTAPGRLRSHRRDVGGDGVDKLSIISKLEMRLCW